MEENERKVTTLNYKWPVLPWALLALIVIATSVLANWNEPFRHWQTRIYFAWPILLASPVLIPWLLYSLYVIWGYPERRRKQGQWVGYVLATFAAVSAAWVVQQSVRGAYAERIIRAVESYNAQHGRYPETLDQVGFNTRTINGQESGTDWWGIAYADGTIGGLPPAIFYPGPLPISMNMYEFNEGHWSYHQD